MFVQHNRKHDKIAKVQLDGGSDVQIASEHVLIVQSEKVKFTGTIHILLLLQYCQALLECCTALNCKFKFVTPLSVYVDLAHAGSSAVQKMDLLKIVPFSPTARSIYIWPHQQ